MFQDFWLKVVFQPKLNRLHKKCLCLKSPAQKMSPSLIACTKNVSVSYCLNRNPGRQELKNSFRSEPDFGQKNGEWWSCQLFYSSDIIFSVQSFVQWILITFGHLDHLLQCLSLGLWLGGDRDDASINDNLSDVIRWVVIIESILTMRSTISNMRNLTMTW